MGFVDSTRFVRSINKVFVSISGFYSNDGQQKLVQRMINDHSVWRSIVEWILSTEDFLFYMVCIVNLIWTNMQDTSDAQEPYNFRALKIHKDSTGLWGDLVFAHKLLEFITRLLTAMSEANLNLPEVRYFYLLFLILLVLPQSNGETQTISHMLNAKYLGRVKQVPGKAHFMMRN